MFTNKKKIGNDWGAVRIENRLLRLLKSDKGFRASLISQDKMDEEDAYSEAQKEFRNAMLEAECKKAKAIMMMQRHRNFC